MKYIDSESIIDNGTTALDDVDALGRTFLLTNLTRHTAQALHRIAAIEHEKGKLPGILNLRRAFLRVLHRSQTFVADVRAEEIPRGLRHAFDDPFAEHAISRGLESEF